MSAPVIESFTSPESVLPTLVSSRPSFWRFVFQTLIAGAIAAIVVFAGIFTASALGAFDKTTVNATVPASTAKDVASSPTGYTFKDPWVMIEGPTGIGLVATRCDPMRDAFRMYMSSEGTLSFQPDAICKKG